MVNWKTIAIILIVLIVLENLFIGYGYYLVAKDDRNIKACYYDVCSENYDADYSEGICTCYDWDVTGSQYVIAKTKVLD